jgi:hypothetical protein
MLKKALGTKAVLARAIIMAAVTHGSDLEYVHENASLSRALTFGLQV